MQTSQRNLLLIGLAAVSGSLDSWSYFGLAHTFIANMTGNTVLLGFALADARWPEAAGTAAALLSYLCGVVIGTALAGPIQQAVVAAGTDAVLWPRRLSALFCLELAMLAAALGIELTHTPIEDGLLAHFLVCSSAAAIGLQSASILVLKVSGGVVTTYITGTWTGTAAGFVQLWQSRGTQRVLLLKRLKLQSAVLATYLAAAAGSGLIFHAGGRTVMGVVPLLLLLAVLAGGLAWGRSSPGMPPYQPSLR